MISGYVHAQQFIEQHGLNFKEKHIPKIKNPAKDRSWNVKLTGANGESIVVRYRVLLTLKEKEKSNDE